MSPVVPLALCMLLISLGLTHAMFSGKWLNPITALFFPHLLLLISYQLSLDRGLFTFELSANAWAILSAAYFCFAAGVVAAYTIAPGSARRGNRRVFDLVEADHFQKTTVLFISILFLSVVSKYVKILTTYGDPFANILQIRKDYVADQLNYGLANSTGFLFSFLIMMNLGILIGSRKPWAKWLAPASITLVILNDFSTGGAYWTFLGLCMMFIARSVTSQVSAPAEAKKRHLTSVLSLAIIPFAMALLLSLRSEGKYGNEISFYDIFVTYMGGNIASFGYFLDNPFPSEPAGRHLLGGIYGLANGALSLFDVNFLPANDPKDYWADIGFGGIPWNTSVHFAYYFADFGWIGLLLTSAALGLLAGATYMKVLSKPSLIIIQYCVVVLYTAVVSIRNVPSEGQYFWLLLVILPAMNAYNRLRHRQGMYRTQPPRTSLNVPRALS